MVKIYLYLLLVVPVALWAQLKKQLVVNSGVGVEQMHFTLSAPSGTCILRPTHHPTPITVYGVNQQKPPHTSHVEGSFQEVLIKLMGQEREGFGQAISWGMFEKEQDQQQLWKVFFTKHDPFYLTLNYGVGEAKVDLSGAQVQRLKMKTGSADVVIGYLTEESNQLEMDTFYVKVDMGTLNIHRLNLAKAKEIIADVGFGNVQLDLSDRCMVKSKVTASVGAGKMKVIMPDQSQPTIIYMRDSPLCHIKLPHNYKAIDKNVFTNSSYQKNAENLLIFDIDVAMGNVIFVGGD